MDKWLKAAHEVLDAMPGKRGKDIPADIFDKIHPHACAATLGVWGRHPTPEQFQALHDQGLHEPHQIHDAFSQMPHPHADGLTVGEYPQWQKAMKSWHQHTKK